MTKKIAILTQPLINNYGGLLQAYALKEVLQEMGHEVVIINRLSNTTPYWRRMASKVKRTLLRQPILTHKKRNYISKNNIAFKVKYIPELSHPIHSQEEMNKLNDMGFDILLAGSDQCWRPIYSPSIGNYFFDFAKSNKNIKRISYAASFGVSHWEFTEEDATTAKELMQLFDAISVREDSAIDLVKEYLGRDDAVHVLDPTMLLNAEHYKKIAKNEHMPQSPGKLKMYILDHTAEKDQIVSSIAQQLGLNSFEVYPKKRIGIDELTKHNIDDFVFPSPAAWLRGFQDAKFVVADSFHGIVFSILFNVPFLAIGNKERGLTRFTSLLRMFKLEDRLITDLTDFDADEFLKKEVDWEKVNKILEGERKKAKEFLINNI